MLATQLNNAENSDAMVKLLLTAEPILEMRNKFGMTALMVAAKRGYSIVVKTLLDAGADFCAVSEVMNPFPLFSYYASANFSLQANERAIDLTKDSVTRAILQQMDDDKVARDRAAHLLSIGAALLECVGRRDSVAVTTLITENIEKYPEFVEFESEEVCCGAVCCTMLFCV